MPTAPLDLCLERLTRQQVGVLVPIYQSSAAALEALHGAGPWCHSPSLAALEREIDSVAFYGVRLGAEWVATFRMALDPPPNLRPGLFRHPSDPAAYLTAMAVHADYQGRGIGRWCMRQAEDMATDWGCLALRFDAYAGPAGAGTFYRKCGFHCVTPLTLRGIDYLVFEKRLHEPHSQLARHPT